MRRVGVRGGLATTAVTVASEAYTTASGDIGVFGKRWPGGSAASSRANGRNAKKPSKKKTENKTNMELRTRHLITPSSLSRPSTRTSLRSAVVFFLEAARFTTPPIRSKYVTAVATRLLSSSSVDRRFCTVHCSVAYRSASALASSGRLVRCAVCDNIIVCVFFLKLLLLLF